MSVAATMAEYRKNLITKRTLYNRVFDTDPGHRVMKDLRKFCKIGQDILVPGDPYATAHNIGCQRVYLHIESILKMDADTIDAIARDRT